MRALLLSDIHADPDYALRCRSATGAPLGSYGCDSPFYLLDRTLEAAKRVLAEPSMLLILGDLVRHDSHSTPTLAHEVFANVTRRIANKFPGISSCAVVIGNNDV